MTRLARTLEQSTQAQTGEDYTPPRERFNEAEIERRQAQAGTGALIIDLQQAGIEHFTLSFLNRIEDPNERARASQFIGGILLNTAPYLTTIHNDPRMRHNHALSLVADNDGWRQTPEGHTLVLESDVAEAARLSAELARYLREGLPVRNLPMKVGKAVGKAAIDLSIWPLSSAMTDLRADRAQLMVREHAQNMQDGAIRLSESLGMRVSAAMLVDELSPVGIHIQRTESNAVVQAYGETMEAYKLAA